MDEPLALCVSHSDADGVLSAVLLSNASPPFALTSGVRFVEAGITPAEFLALFMDQPGPGSTLTILDLGLTAQHLVPLVEAGWRIKVFDHHPQTRDLPAERIEVHWEEDGRAACEVVSFTVGCPPGLEQIMTAVAAHDTGRDLGNPIAAYVGALIKGVGPRAVLERLVCFSNEGVDEFRFAVEAGLYREHARAREEAAFDAACLSFMTTFDSQGRMVVIVPSEIGAGVSVIGKRLLDEVFPHAAYVVFVDFNTAQFSLRSRPGGVDVGEIARRLGGGGHPAASGARVILDPDEQF